MLRARPGPWVPLAKLVAPSLRTVAPPAGPFHRVVVSAVGPSHRAAARAADPSLRAAEWAVDRSLRAAEPWVKAAGRFLQVVTVLAATARWE